MIKNYLKKLMFLFIALAFSGLTYGQVLLNEGFGTGTTLPASWVVVNAGAGNNWTVNGTGGVTGSCLYYAYSSTNNANTWAFTPDLAMEAGKSYVIQFQQKTQSATFPEKLKVTIGKGQTVVAQTTVINDLGSLANTTYSLRSYTYNCTETGNYNVAFNCYSDANMYNLYVDDVKIFVPITPEAPTTFSASVVSQTGMTLNWVDNSINETGFRVYYSTDGINYAKYGTDITSTSVATTGDAYNQVLTGFLPGTTYQFRIVSFTDNESVYLTGSQATSAAGAIYSIKDGNWSDTLTWNTNKVPTNGDNVTITAGDTVTLNVNGFGNNIAINGTLSLQNYTLTVVDATVSNTGIVNIASGTIGTISIAGNLTNNGVMDFYASSTVYGKLLFTGATNNAFNCDALSTTDLGNVEINKGNSINSIIDIVTAGTFTIKGLAVGTNGFLTLTKGTLKLSGNVAISNPVFLTNSYSITANSGLWLNNPNFVVTALNGSPNNNGLLRITAGTYNVGTAAGNSLGGAANSIFTIEGGILNLASRMQTSSAVTLNISGGVINVNTVGNTSGSACFGFTSTSNTINISGGTINLEKRSTAATPLDYNVNGSTVNITGGVLNVGTPTTATNFDFRIQGYTPTIVIDTVNNKKSALLSGTTIVYGDVVINSGATLNLQASVLSVYGNATQIGNVVNNGVITQTSGSTIPRFNFYGSNGNQAYSGTGILGSNTNAIAGMSVSNPLGVTLNSPVIVNRFNLFNGLVTGSNKITLGIGGTSTPVVQKGGTATIAAGTFDQSPIFNPGTSYSVFYSSALNPYNTGFELKDTISGTITISTNVDVTLTKSVVTEKISFPATNVGKLITTNANLLLVKGIATTDVNIVAGNTGYVSGPMAITLPASLANGTTFKLPIGKGTANMMELVSPTTTADGKVVIKAEVVDAATGGTAGTGIQAASLGNRYWVSEIVSGASNFKQTTVAFTQNAPALTADNALAKSATLTGAYDLTSTLSPVGNKISSDTITSLGYFAIGLKAVPQSYTSSVAFQNDSTVILQGATNQQIIGLKIVTNGNYTPLTATNFVFNTNGTTNNADILNAKLYYTGASATFATTTQVGSTVATPAGAFTINPSQVLNDGNNYFWLTYDVNSTFTNFNVVDAEIRKITIGGVEYTPADTAPSAKRVLRTPLAGVYTVGATGNFTTITNAVKELNSLGVSAPVEFSLIDTLYSTGETYPIVINNVIGGTSVNTITIKPAIGVDSKIICALASNVFVVNGAENVIFDGSNVVNGSTKNLTLRNNTTTGTFNMTIAFFNNGTKGASNCTVKNTINIGNPLITNSYGLFLNAGGGNFNHITFTNNTIKNAKVAMQFVGVAGNLSKHGIITNNIIGDSLMPIKTIGISIGNVDSTFINGNNIFGEIAGNSNSSQRGIMVGASSTNTVITNNHIHDFYYTGTGGYGCFGIYYGAEATSTTLIANNMISNIKADGDKVSGGTGNFGYIPSGISIKSGGNVKIYNNTINLTGNVLGSAYTGNSSCIMIDALVTDLDIRNNILKNSMTAIVPNVLNKTYAIVSYAANTIFTEIDYNNYFVNGSNPNIGYIAAADVADLAAWKTASTKDANSLNIEPIFVSAGNLHLSTSANCLLSNKGTALALVTTDIDGDARNVSTPDMGADEFTFVAPSIVASVSTPLITGFTLNLNPAVDGLLTSNLVVNPGNIVPTTVTTTDNGATYNVDAALANGTNYTLVINEGCYSFNEPTFATPAATHTITFNVVGSNGTLAATVDGNAITSPATVQEGKNVVFTATPSANYRVKEWKLDNVVVAGNTTNNYTLSNVTANATVTVEFELIPVTTYTVTFNVVGSNGTLGATVNSVAVTSPATVEQGSNVVFTATPAANYEVKEWKLDNVIVAGNTTNNYTLTNLSANSTVTVEFKVIVGIEDATENTYSVYPVPANDFVNVKSNVKMSRIAIVNIHGQVVSETIVDNDNANLNTSNLSNGMYQLRIETANGITMKKIQITK